MSLTTPSPNAESASPSWWVASTDTTGFPLLTSDLETDVVVLGAGIAGITTAYALAREGRQVVLLEAGRVAEGVSGYTTAKVSVGHNLIYADLAQRFDEQTARLYAQSQSAALEWLCTTAADLDCELERRPSVVYTEIEEDRSAIEEEVAAATAAGLRASLVTETDLPYPVVAGVRLEDQAQFHPRRYLLALVEAFRGLGGEVFEQTRATDVEGTVVVTPRARVTANEVVVATHYPFLDRGLLFARLAQYRDVVVSFAIPEASAPEVMAISNGSEEGGTHSVRTAPYRDGERLLIVTGGQFKSGTTSEVETQYDELAGWARSRFPVGELLHRWSTQDASSVDRLPYIGTLPNSGDHVWVATGFSAWGMTGGTMAGLLLTDLIQGRESQWAQMYDPSRKDVRPSASTFLKENKDVAVELVKGQFRYDVATADELSAGEAGIFSGADGLTAGYRDDSGALHCVSARCTHLGCTVRFNDAERSWDCPCHGSRFGIDGVVLHGPAVDPLAPHAPS
jgi:glycine/D-amino acid oxidase-like deaminating enzyme/nitrite reductase/ring-hydroxylating ferredoxin subunit